METKGLGIAPRVGRGNGGLCCAPLSFVADAGQFRAALHAGVFSAADRVGKFLFCSHDGEKRGELAAKLRLCSETRGGSGKDLVPALVLVDGRFAAGLDLVRLLVDLLVVLDVGVDRGLVVARRLIEALLQLDGA